MHVDTLAAIINNPTVKAQTKVKAMAEIQKRLMNSSI